MKFPNKYLRNLRPYKLASHKIWAVKPEERPQVLKLDWNESTIPPSPLVRQRIEQCLAEPSFFNLYPTTYNEELLTLLSKYVELPIENVQYFGSSDVLHEYICKAFISVGDPVMILGPSYDNFRLTCQANGADVYFSNYREDFTFDKEQFENDILTREPAVVYICSPNNPTGNVHTKEYIEHLLQEYPDTLFLIDEAYYEFSGITAKDLVLKYDNILVTRTMSKAFGLANFRVGYLMASRDNVQFINKIRNPKNLSTFAQVAACAALNDTDYMWHYVDEVHKGMAYFYKESLKYAQYYTAHESHGNFILLKFPTQDEKMALHKYLADNNIFARDTTQSPLVQNCFRITIGTVEQMQRVINVISKFYNNK
ncbi:MAG: histidinol-phosphate aminotransferase family protein [Paludibacteraceae bacterium]|nr:histidinol-phosphate aminotransferase family protein [Paludibacteraceae bacterium]